MDSANLSLSCRLRMLNFPPSCQVPVAVDEKGILDLAAMIIGTAGGDARQTQSLTFLLLG